VLRGALIGFGNVAEKGHLPGWQLLNDVSIVAATDVVASRREAFLGACPNGRWYGSVGDLLADQTLDFVDVCTPPSSHAPLIKQALQADLHILCEKPLVTRQADAQFLATASRRAGRVVYTVHNWLKAPVCMKVSALIAAGAIGSTRSINWRTLRTQPAITVTSEAGTNWRVDPVTAGGGILFDHGWHALYCTMRWGGAPRGIAAVLENRRFPEFPLEDTATVDLDLISGTGHIYLTWASEERSNYIEIAGDEGSINVANELVVLKTNSMEHQWFCPPSLSEGSHHPDWFIGVAEDFRLAMTDGNRRNLEEAMLCTQLIDLAQQSSLAGGVHLSTGD
jgi:predicted dehydrogenase